MVKKNKFFEKTVKVGRSEVLVFSLDGVTWSSNKAELEALLERYDKQLSLYGEQIVVGPQSKARIEAKKSRTSGKKTIQGIISATNISDDYNESSFSDDDYSDDFYRSEDDESEYSYEDEEEELVEKADLVEKPKAKKSKEKTQKEKPKKEKKVTAGKKTKAAK